MSQVGVEKQIIDDFVAKSAVKLENEVDVMDKLPSVHGDKRVDRKLGSITTNVQQVQEDINAKQTDLDRMEQDRTEIETVFSEELNAERINRPTSISQEKWESLLGEMRQDAKNDRYGAYGTIETEGMVRYADERGVSLTEEQANDAYGRINPYVDENTVGNGIVDAVDILPQISEEISVIRDDIRQGQETLTRLENKQQVLETVRDGFDAAASAAVASTSSSNTLQEQIDNIRVEIEKEVNNIINP